MEQAATSTPTRRLVLVDAMRALAVIAVVLFHVFPHRVRGGFIGVDIFFAISGFVIALNYLDALVDRTVSFRAFFARRVRRLVPAYFVLLIVVTGVAVMVMTPKDLQNYGQSLAAQAVYMQNAAFWTQGNYFDDPLLKPLLHTWSLAVEEQFYLIFPLLVLGFRYGYRIGIALLGAVTVISIIFALKFVHVTEVGTFFLLPSRVWEFTLGIASALAYRRVALMTLSPALCTTLAVAGIGAMVVAAAAFDERSIFPSLQAALALAGACVVVIVQSHVAPLLHRAAGNRVVQHFGQISYSWYLWHWPIVSFHMLITNRPLTPVEAVAALVLGYAAAVASYYGVELWGQRTPLFRGRGATLTLLAAFTGSALICGGAIAATHGMIDRYSGRARLIYAAQMDRPPRRCPVIGRLLDHSRSFCRYNDAEPGPGVLLIGDSHADLMKPVMSRMATTAHRPFYLNAQDCRVIDYGHDFNCPVTAWRHLLSDIKSARVTDVIVISRYAQDFDAQKFIAAIKDLVATGAHVTIEPTAPESAEFDPETWINIGRANDWPTVSHYTRAEYEHDYAPILTTMRELTKSMPQVSLVEPVALLCPDHCLIARDGMPLYHDRHHLTSYGASLVAPYYATTISGKRS